MAKKKYFEVYFGNRVQLYEILISQTLSSDLATQFEVEFSNDRKSWFGAEQVIYADTTSNPPNAYYMSHDMRFPTMR